MADDPRDLSDSSWFRPDELSSYAEFLTGNSSEDQRNFMTLMEMIGEMITEPDYRTLLRRMIATILRLNESERGILLMKRADQYPVRVALGANGEDLGHAPPLARSVIDTVIKTGRPIIERVDASHKVLDLSHSVAAMRLRQIMCAPLRAGGEVMGIVYVDSRLVGRPHGREDLLLFNAQAGLIAMAVQNHRLIRETLAAREMQQELQTARQIQLGLLPESPMSHAGLELAGISEPSSRVGGDYFDFLPVDMNRCGIVVGDVSGHGIGPALIMSNVRAHLRSLLLTRKRLGGLYGFMNRALCEDLTNGMFVALFVAVYDAETRLLEFQNAGQVPPLIYSPEEDRFLEIGTNAPALGVIDDISAGPCPSTPMKPGDYMLCITDGVTEAPNDAGGMYGDERVRSIFRSLAREGASPSRIVAALREDVGAYMGEIPTRDDITIVAMRF
ncbi:MAG: PP2C family protein-serine/threonine phosphatase [Planctomycetota bacterium]|jgi:serine phosphatase RsbU (regulator of sigma subunit)